MIQFMVFIDLLQQLMDQQIRLELHDSNIVSKKKVDKKNHKLRAELFASDAKLVLPHYFYYDTVLLYF